MISAESLPLDRLPVRRAAIAGASAIALGLVLGAFGPPYAAAALGAIAVIVWAALAPEKALVLLALALYAPVRESLSQSVNVTLGDAILGLIAIGWLLWAWRKGSLRVDRDPVYAALLVVVAAPLLSLISSPDKTLTLVGAVRSFELWLLLFVVVLSAVRTTGALTWLLKAFVAVAAIEALVGVYQFVTQTGAYVATSYSRAIGTGSLYSWLDFAISLGCATTLVAADLLVRRKAGAWRWLVLAALVAGTLATYTRGVWIAFVAALAVMVLASRPRALIALAIIASIALALVAANPQGDLAKRAVSVGDPTDPSVVQRTYLWQTAIRMWEANPLIGAGAKSFPALRDRFAVPGLEVYSYHDTPGVTLKVELLSPHEFYLMVLAETGIVGLLSFLVLFGLLLVRGMRTATKAASSELKSAALGLSGVLVFLMVHATIGDVFAGPIALTAAFLLACLAAAAQIHERESAAKPTAT